MPHHKEHLFAYAQGFQILFLQNLHQESARAHSCFRKMQCKRGHYWSIDYIWFHTDHPVSKVPATKTSLQSHVKPTSHKTFLPNFPLAAITADNFRRMGQSLLLGLQFPTPRVYGKGRGEWISRGTPHQHHWHEPEHREPGVPRALPALAALGWGALAPTPAPRRGWLPGGILSD